MSGWRLKSRAFRSTVCSGTDQIRYQSSASLAFVSGIHKWPCGSPHKEPETRRCFHFMTSSWSIWKGNIIKSDSFGTLISVIQLFQNFAHSIQNDWLTCKGVTEQPNCCVCVWGDLRMDILNCPGNVYLWSFRYITASWTCQYSVTIIKIKIATLIIYVRSWSSHHSWEI